MTNAISMTGLTKHYKEVRALTDLTLDVPDGTVFGFLGPNGAGKTTALKILAGRATLRYVASFRAHDSEREKRIDTLLGRVGIADAADRRTATYSGGMRQRLGIAQALVGRPAVILLD